MQSINVLGHHSQQLSLLLKLGELVVRLVGLGRQADHALAIEVVELLGMRLVEAMRQHGLGWIFKMLMVEPVS